MEWPEVTMEARPWTRWWIQGSAVTKEDITGLGIPAQDTTYSKATAQVDGLMSKEHFTKLEGLNASTTEEVQAMLDEVYPQTA